MAPVTLVTGGAGYIGSHTVRALLARDHQVVVLDDLSEGHTAALLGAPLERCSLRDRGAVERVFASHQIRSVVHFAARCYVGESVADPGLYYRANVETTLNLLEAMEAHGVRNCVFSSSCATYGEPARIPIDETVPLAPVTPYGETKLVCEWMLASYHTAHGLRSVSLRYFNAAGASADGDLGEDHRPETHLIPLVIAAAMGRRGEMTVFGDDYDTPDGTCVRDYVHVSDLAAAHVLALEALEKGRVDRATYNLGNELGTSVMDVVKAVEEVGSRKVPYRIGRRRPGDPPRLVGTSAKISSDLGWRPRLADIRRIVETAWCWHEAHPNGYAD